MSKISLAIHGGAGTILKELMTPELEQEYIQALNASLTRGYVVLEKGGTAVDAVQAAVMILEDNVLFNAGRGSVFTNKGSHEMDAAIMDGQYLRAGAVSAVKNIRNPVELAYAIMTKSQHVMMTGQGAYDFAKLNDIKTEPDEYFYSEFRYNLSLIHI